MVSYSTCGTFIIAYLDIQTTGCQSTSVSCCLVALLCQTVLVAGLQGWLRWNPISLLTYWNASKSQWHLSLFDPCSPSFWPVTLCPWSLCGGLPWYCAWPPQAHWIAMSVSTAYVLYTLSWWCGLSAICIPCHIHKGSCISVQSGKIASCKCNFQITIWILLCCA